MLSKCRLKLGFPIFFIFFLLVKAFLITSPALAQTTHEYSISPPNQATFYGSFQGFGAEWDPFFWNTNNLNRGTTQADWELITTRMKELNVGIVRMMMQLNWAQSNQDLSNWTWDTPQMQSVYKYLDFACTNNIDVILTDWGWAVRGDPYNSPTDQRYATGVAEYMKEFIDRRGYSCIKYLVLGNEPDNEIQKDYGMAAYVTMYQNVDQALKNNGMRSKVKLMGPDMGGNWDFMKDGITQLKNVVDAYDFHRYASTNETSNTDLPGTWESLWSHLDMWRGEVNSRDSQGANKPLLLTEMGNSGGSTNSHPNIDTFEYALHMADYGTTLLTTRVNAGIAWTMHDIYYFDGGQYMQWGMWKYRDNNWQIRSWGQAYGLLIKHAPKGSIPAAINGTPPATPTLTQQRVAAVKRPDGTWAAFLVNRETSAVTVNLHFPENLSGTFNRYLFDQTTTAAQPNSIALPPTNQITAAKDLSISLPAQSFTVLVQNDGGGVPTVTTAPTCREDINQDNFIDLSDYAVLVANFLADPVNDARADINQDSIVDISDYSLLVNRFFQTCE